MVANLFKTIGCFFILFFFCCIACVVILIFRPAAIWDKIADAVYDDSIQVDTSHREYSEIVESLNNQITGVGENVVTLSESDLSYLVQHQMSAPNIFFDLHPNNATLLYRIDDKPVFAYLELETDSQNLSIKKTGLGKIQFPGFISGLLEGVVKRALSGTTLDSFIFENVEGVQLKNMMIKEGEISLLINFNPKVF